MLLELHGSLGTVVHQDIGEKLLYTCMQLIIIWDYTSCLFEAIGLCLVAFRNHKGGLLKHIETPKGTVNVILTLRGFFFLDLGLYFLPGFRLGTILGG